MGGLASRRAGVSDRPIEALALPAASAPAKGRFAIVAPRAQDRQIQLPS
jgi:hypothetical protein